MAISIQLPKRQQEKFCTGKTCHLLNCKDPTNQWVFTNDSCLRNVHRLDRESWHWIIASHGMNPFTHQYWINHCLPWQPRVVCGVNMAHKVSPCLYIFRAGVSKYSSAKYTFYEEVLAKQSAQKAQDQLEGDATRIPSPPRWLFIARVWVPSIQFGEIAGAFCAQKLRRPVQSHWKKNTQKTHHLMIIAINSEASLTTRALEGTCPKLGHMYQAEDKSSEFTEWDGTLN